MEKNMVINGAELAGRVVAGPGFDHKIYGEAFYMMTLGVLRKSGYEDRVRLIVSEKILAGRAPREGQYIKISGQIRTYNKEICGRSKLEVVVFVKALKYEKDKEFSYENNVLFEGYICKPPIRRSSPLGREICDLMIAVNRMYNKSDYIPTIAWGRNAEWCEDLDVGDKVRIEGRLQSRMYKKYTEEGLAATKTAYEVSVVNIDLV